MDQFYVHSVEVEVHRNRWVVFKRPGRAGDKPASKLFEARGGADKLCSQMNADWRRYQIAMLNKTDVARGATGSAE